MPVTRRRTISLDKFVEQNINNLRAMALTYNVELDFTSMINAFAEYGIKKRLADPGDPMFQEIIEKYMTDEELQEQAIYDSWSDMRTRKMLTTPKTDVTTKKDREQVQGTTKTNSYIS